MSVVSTNRFWDAEVDRAANLIMQMVRAHAVDGQYRSTIRAMGGYCQTPKRTVKRGLRKLETAGLITTEVNATNTGLIITLIGGAP